MGVFTGAKCVHWLICRRQTLQIMGKLQYSLAKPYDSLGESRIWLDFPMICCVWRRRFDPGWLPLLILPKSWRFYWFFSRNHKNVGFDYDFGTRNQKLKNLIAAVFGFPVFWASCSSGDTPPEIGESKNAWIFDFAGFSNRNQFSEPATMPKP